MKKIFLYLCAFWIYVSNVSAAEPPYPYQDKGGYWVYERFFFSAATGNFDISKNWKDDKIPSGVLPRAEINGGCSAVLDRPFKTDISSLQLRLDKVRKTEFLFTKNAKLNAGYVYVPVTFLKGMGAEFTMSGGALTIGDFKDPKGSNGFLCVGVSITHSSTGHFVISGGTLTGGIQMGSDVRDTNIGVFTVQGSLPTVTTHLQPRNWCEVWRSGTFEFILDEKGVSSIDFRKSTVRFHDGASVRVDGSRYKGPSKNIEIIQAGRFIREGKVNLEAAGFTPPYQGTLSLEDNGVWLKIVKRGG